MLKKIFKLKTIKKTVSYVIILGLFETLLTVRAKAPEMPKPDQVPRIAAN
jgi:hypothetical protein